MIESTRTTAPADRACTARLADVTAVRLPSPALRVIPARRPARTTSGWSRPSTLTRVPTQRALA